ncbi:cytochrome P450 [Sphaerisporangium corydalis]|uniref:Cytochrome P450 n=1 Tax=Sphaerisporangium corydalis TaxID=1441875 RepID=A0ABV9EJN2_9ACTN|nr:cytochrome P450 [Sphaerisporangium corydalis]
MPRYDPFDHDLQSDPWPTYEWLREERPLYHAEDLGFHALSRHADVDAAYRDTALFSSSHGVTLEQWGPDAHRFSSFLAMDPPRHTGMRALVSAGFTPRRVREMEPVVRRLAVRHLDAALAGGGTFDLIGDYAAKVPVDVISTMIGVPAADRPRIRTWSERLLERPDGVRGVPGSMREANRALAGYYADLVRERRREPADDLASALIHAEAGGAALTDRDIVPVLMLLGVAGNETTAKLVGNAWHAAWRDPGQREAAWDGGVAGWVEETLRWDGPGQMSARLLTADTVFHGVTVPAGSRVLLLVGAANRDPRVFADPGRFDIGRDTGDAVPFAVGPHFCLGAGLARLEARVMLEELTARVRPGYEIDLRAARRAYNPNVHGFATLPTTVGLR